MKLLRDTARHETAYRILYMLDRQIHTSHSPFGGYCNQNQRFRNYKSFATINILMQHYGFQNPDGYMIGNYAGKPAGEQFLKRLIDLFFERKEPLTLPLTIYDTFSFRSNYQIMFRLQLLPF